MERRTYEDGGDDEENERVHAMGVWVVFRVEYCVEWGALQEREEPVHISIVHREAYFGVSFTS